jgi:hypothetical protein
MKTTGVLPEALASCISRFSLSEIAVTSVTRSVGLRLVAMSGLLSIAATVPLARDESPP